jgi:NADP-dependent 3-hydroxy acid dehydrogenase YdfG
MAWDSFRDKVMIIIGASCGISEALAYRFSKEGAWLAIASGDADRLIAAAQKCIANSRRGNIRNSIAMIVSEYRS